MTGASFTAATLIVLVPILDAWFALAPSSIAQLIVRVTELAVGFSLVEEYVTVLRAVWYCATVAVPDKVKTPTPLLYEPLMPFWFEKPSTSPVVNPPEILTVAPVKFKLSASLTVKPLLMAVAASFSV